MAMSTRDVVNRPCEDACGTVKTDRTVEGAPVYQCPGCDAEWIELDERTGPASAGPASVPPAHDDTALTLENVGNTAPPNDSSAATQAASTSHQDTPPVYPRLVQTVLDARDIRTLAEFYRAFLGLAYRPGDAPPFRGTDDADWLVLTHPGGGHALAFQADDHQVPPTWPKHGVPQQLHLDLTVPDRASLDAARDRAIALGARVLFDRSADPDEPLYVFADPAGHPFCVFTSSPPASAAATS